MRTRRCDRSVQRPQLSNYDGSTFAGDGFIFTNGVYTSLSGPLGSSFVPFGISDGGTIVGNWTNLDGGSRAFIREDGTYSEFVLPGASSTYLRGISSNGRYLTGQSDISPYGSFVFDRLTSEKWIFDTASAIVQSVNNLGMAVGSVRFPDQGPFVHDFMSGVTTFYEPPVDNYRGINNLGRVVGWTNNRVAIVGVPGSMQEFPSIGAEGTFARSINDDNWIVGRYEIDADQFQSAAFLARPVPEPDLQTLWLGGLLAISFAVRVRRRLDGGLIPALPN